jgi:hypothetical protein
VYVPPEPWPQPAGPPTWPTHPRPIANAATQPALSHSSPGIGWTPIALALIGGLLAIGAAAAITTRRRDRAAA